MRLLLILCLFLPSFFFAQTDKTSLITVVGESTLEVKPNEVELRIFVSEKENLKKEHISVLDEVEKEIKKILDAYKIPVENLAIESLGASRNRYYKDNSSKIHLSKSYQLKTKKVEVIDNLILDLFEAGADNVTIVTKETEQIRKLKNDASVVALKHAKLKAERMAAFLGMKIYKAVKVTEFIPELDGIDNDTYWQRDYNNHLMASVTRAAPTSNQESIRLKTIKITKKVKAVFEMK